jgi:hypothetical protein
MAAATLASLALKIWPELSRHHPVHTTPRVAGAAGTCTAGSRCGVAGNTEKHDGVEPATSIATAASAVSWGGASHLARPNYGGLIKLRWAPLGYACIDFKGKFRIQDGNWCHVLTCARTLEEALTPSAPE